MLLSRSKQGKTQQVAVEMHMQKCIPHLTDCTCTNVVNTSFCGKPSCDELFDWCYYGINTT